MCWLLLLLLCRFTTARTTILCSIINTSHRIYVRMLWLFCCTDDCFVHVLFVQNTFGPLSALANISPVFVPFWPSQQCLPVFVHLANEWTNVSHLLWCFCLVVSLCDEFHAHSTYTTSCCKRAASSPNFVVVVVVVAVRIVTICLHVATNCMRYLH